MARRKNKSTLGRISMRLELHPDQTLSSFLSSVAVYNGFRSAGRFCVAMGIDTLGLRRGDTSALDDLASVTGACAQDLRDAGSWRSGSGFMHAGQKVAWLDLRRQTHICPVCATEDRQARNKLGAHAPVIGRPWWSHAMVRTCVQHDLRLMPLPDLETPKLFKEDLAAQLRQAANAGMTPAEIPQTAGLIDHYVTERFAGGDKSDFQAETLDDVLFLSCFLGLAHCEGKSVAVPASAEKRFDATELGLAIILRGEAAVEDRLREIARQVNPHRACEIGLSRVFGSLFGRLEDRDKTSMKSIRRMLVAIGVDMHLIAFEDQNCLGLAVPARSLQTLESARRRFGISDRELRSSAIEMGLLPSKHTGVPANQILIDMADAAEVLEQLKDCINLNAAATSLGLMPQQLVKLCEEEVIRPLFIRQSEDLKPLRYFRREDLAIMISDLNKRAVRSSDAALVDVWEAGLKTCRQPSDIIAAITDGRIRRIYKHDRLSTFRDIRLSLDDVRAGMHEVGEQDLVVAEDCCSLLKINLTAMRKILHAGLVKPTYTKNPVNLRSQVAVRREDLEAFHKTFASLNALGQEWGCSASTMKRALSSLKILPAFATNTTEVLIYRRASVSRFRKRVRDYIDDKSIKHEVRMRLGQKGLSAREFVPRAVRF